MDETVRERAVFPIGVPLGIFLAILAVVFLFSRILLNVPKQVAVAVALMTALNILVTCAVIALRRPRGVAALFLVVVVAVPVILGGAAAAKVITVKKPHKATAAAGPGAAEASTGPIALNAANLAFNKSTITVAANTPITINFHNADTQPHNFHILSGPAAAGQPEIAQPGQSVTYQIPAMPPGSYQFHCDLHPSSMVGTWTVVQPGGGAPSGGGAAPSGPVSLSAVNLAFNKSTIEIAANTPTTVNFRNADTQPHNFHILSGPAAAGSPEIAQPGQSATYQIPAMPAGSYQYHCDLHPSQMTGTLTVK
jgi:plastocyanin